MENYCEKIRTYLDNTFASLPQSEAAMCLKNDMYCSMLDKFNGLVQGGANEDEAFGKVVGEFGSLDEIRAALGIDSAAGAYTATPISTERKKAYDKFQIKQGILISIGVILCIFAVFGYGLYEKFTSGLYANFIFALSVAVGVFLFVFAGTSGAKFFDVTNPVIYAVPPTPERMESYQKFLTLRSWLMGFAIALFIIPIGTNSWVQDVAIPILISVGIAILIIVGTIHSTYEDVRGKK